jgi:CRISPR/Cas system-associated exonuclease Cas4 (RecB family)
MIPPTASLLEAVIEELPGTFQETIVVFPGKRPAHFLRKALAVRAGKTFFPPRIFSIDNFVSFLFSEKLGRNPLLLEPIDAVALLFAIHARADTGRIGEGHFRSFDEFLPVGLQLFGELEEVMMTHLPVNHIRLALEKIAFPKFHSLGYYYEEFYAEATRLGRSTRSMMYREVAERIGEIDFSPGVVLAGFSAFTKTEAVLTRGILADANARLLVEEGPGVRDRLADLGIELPPSSADPAPEPALKFYRSPDLHGQVFALAAMLQEHVASGKPVDERTVIVLPSSDLLFPVMHHALPLIPAGAYNISLGYPLDRTPAYGFLQGLLELAAASHEGRFSSAAYLRFALHPYTKNIRFRTSPEITRMLFHALEVQFARSKPLVSLDELEQNEELLASIASKLSGTDEEITPTELRDHLASIHRNTIRKIVGVTTIREFAIVSMEVLNYIFAESTANLHPFFRPYVERLTEVLDHLSTSLVGDQQLSHPAGYAAFLRSAVAPQSVPFAGTPLQGIQVLGLLETRNIPFDTVYLLEASDDVLPGAARPDMLLPLPVRAMLGLETSRDREELSAYYFDLVVKRAKEAHIFYTESGRKEKSRFVEKLFWNRQRKEQSLETSLAAEQVKYSVKLANGRPEPIEKTESALGLMRSRLRISAWTLDTYLSCPLKFYHQHILGLDEKAEVSDEIDASDVGRLVHAVLKRLYAPLVGRPLASVDLSLERLAAAIDASFDETYGAESGGAVSFLKAQVHRQLAAFLEHYQHPVLAEHRVMISGLERSIAAEYRGRLFTGRIDRVELRDGMTTILDYKTGHDDTALRIRTENLIFDDRSSWRAAIGSFQLPLYMLLHSVATGTKVEDIRPAYLFLGRPAMNTAVEVGLEDAPETYHAVEPVIFALIEEMLDPRQPFRPTEDLEQHCPRCPFASLCGTQWVQGWEP